MRFKRYVPGASIGVLGLLALVAAVVPASGATSNRGAIRTKVMTSPRASLVATPNEDDGGADEKEQIRDRGLFEAAIAASPAAALPSRGLSAAIKQAAALPTVGGAWNEITKRPFLNDPVNRGDNYGVGWGFVTGRMTAFTASGGALYAGAASGGVWRTTDLGSHWTDVSRGLPRLPVGALATDPRNGSIIVGTGESNNASENQYGIGAYRLARGSSTWTQIGGDELNGAGFYRIRSIGGYLYAATSHGLWRRAESAPDSATWQRVLRPDPNPNNSPYRTSFITDVLAVPGTNGRQVLAADGWAGFAGAPQSIQYNGFYVGSGAAGSFHRITPQGAINPRTIGRTSFSTSGGWLYAVVQDTSTDTLVGQGVFLSRSGSPAGPWTRIATSNKFANSDSALEAPDAGLTTYFPGVQAWYNQYILADPQNRQHVYVGLEEVYETTSAGAKWNTVGPYWNFDISCDPADDTPYNCPGTTHPDQHAGFLYAGRLWEGNDGGVWNRPVTQHTRGYWTNRNPGLDTLQYYSAAVGPVRNGRAYWGGMQDNGETYWATGMTNVEQAFTGDGGDTIVDPRNGNRAVEEYVDQDLYMTSDGGVTLTEISPSCLTATDPPDPCDPNPRFIAPIEQDVHDATHWVSGGQYVWDDHKGWNTVCAGATCDWKPVYDTGDGHQVTALAMNGRTIYAGWCGPCNPNTGEPFDRGLATNAGGSWHELNMSKLPNRYITSIATDPADAAHVYVSFGSFSRRWIPTAGYGHVFETRNGGATWSNVSGNLPDAPVYKVAIRGGQLIAGSEVGAFIANRSRPTSWARLGSNLPNVTVWDLAVTPDSTSVVAGTHGRGQWTLRLP